MTEAVMKFLKDAMRLDIADRRINFIIRLGRRKGQQPILAKFTSFVMKLEVLRNTKHFAGSKIGINEDFSLETRRVRRSELIPYLKEAKSRGHRAFIKDKPIVNGRI
jgi:hypothetical protein